MNIDLENKIAVITWTGRGIVIQKLQNYKRYF